jgi:hypothetical protein
MQLYSIRLRGSGKAIGSGDLLIDEWLSKYGEINHLLDTEITKDLVEVFKTQEFYTDHPCFT